MATTTMSDRPAFPRAHGHMEGMTLFEFFVGSALAGAIMAAPKNTSADDVAARAIDVADATIAALRKHAHLDGETK